MSADRLPFCGGTDAAAIVCSARGLPYYRSAWDVWAERKAPLALPPRAPVEQRWLDLGTALESFVLTEYGRRIARDELAIWHGIKVAAPPPTSWMRGSLDCTIIDGTGQIVGLADAKTSRQRHHWVEERDGLKLEVYPPGYEVQVRWYLGLLRVHQLAARLPLASFADLVALDLLTTELHCRTIQHDPIEWADIVGIVIPWWERYILGDEVPPDDDSECCQRWHLYCQNRRPESQEATQEQAEAMLWLADALEEQRAVDFAVEKGKTRLLALMGTERLTIGGPRGPYAQIQNGARGAKVLRLYRFPASGPKAEE